MKIVELQVKVRPDYPYSHRIELDNDLIKYEKIVDWLAENKIPAYVSGYSSALYLTPESYTWFLLKWM
jgi:hypothetical protein